MLEASWSCRLFDNLKSEHDDDEDDILLKTVHVFVVMVASMTMQLGQEFVEQISVTTFRGKLAIYVHAIG